MGRKHNHSPRMTYFDKINAELIKLAGKNAAALGITDGMINVAYVHGIQSRDAAIQLIRARA
jgi:hypothetical protein